MANDKAKVNATDTPVAGSAPAGSPAANEQAAAATEQDPVVPDEARVGPAPGDDPEANPSHPSSLRIRRSDGEPVLKSTRGGQGDAIADQPPGFESAEPNARAVPSHPSKIVPFNDASNPSAARLIDATAPQPESDASSAASRDPERDKLLGDVGKSEKRVIYEGPGAVTVIVPDKASVSYDDLITEGTTYNFRPGEARVVPAKHAAWLKAHTALTFTTD